MRSSVPFVTAVYISYNMIPYIYSDLDSQITPNNTDLKPV